MKALKYLLIVFTSLIALGVFLLWWVGIFDQMKLEQRQQPAYVVAGINFKGSYQQIGPIMAGVDSSLRSIGINCEKGFGIYYNDPNVTPEADLESYVGNVIEGEQLERLSDIEKLNIQIDTIPSGLAWVASLPIRNQLSYMIGPVRAYPALEQAVNDSADVVSLVYEIYNVAAEEAHYVMLVE
jgi:DNA gyrase inhibitor GyrI